MKALSFDEVLKDSPSVGDVHVGTALGNQKKPKSDDDEDKTFDAFISGGTKPMDPVYGTDVTKLADRLLKPIDENNSHTPFPYEAGALHKLREDQMPRFLGAITDQDKLPLATMHLGDLTAIQNRVDHGKVAAMRVNRSRKHALVVSFAGRHYIADGHHRLAADYLDHRDEARVRHLDISQPSNLVKRDGEAVDIAVPFNIIKVEPTQRLVFGWLSVVEKNGKMIVDKQGDMIPVDELEKAAYEYVLTSRDGGDMHITKGASRLVESMVFTKEKQELLKIDLGMVGWWGGYFVDSDTLWDAYKKGDRPEFSIGGQALRINIG